MGFGSLIEIATLGLVDGDDIDGTSAANAARDAANIQASSGQEAIDFQREALEIVRSDLQPFKDLFFGGSNADALRAARAEATSLVEQGRAEGDPQKQRALFERAGDAMRRVNAILESPELQGAPQAQFQTLLEQGVPTGFQQRAAEIGQGIGGISTFQPSANNIQTFEGGGPLSPTISPEQVDIPRTLEDVPFIQDLIDTTTREVSQGRAAGGQLFSGGTQEELIKRLAPQAANILASETNRALASRGQLTGEQSALFGQQLGGRQLSAGEQAQGFGQQTGLRALTAGEQAQQFGQQTTLPALQSQALGAEIGAALTPQQQQFNQLFDVLRLSQGAAAGQAGAQQATAGQVGNLLTGIGNAQAAGQVGAAQAQSNALGGLFGLGGQLGSAALLSDIRTKENIRPLGDINGIPWFEFDYIDGPKNQQGTMAQMVEKDYPEAVIDIDGVKHVYYGRLPIWH